MTSQLRSIRERFRGVSWILGILGALAAVAWLVATNHSPAVARRCAVGTLQFVEGVEQYGAPRTWVVVDLDDGRRVRVSDPSLSFRPGARVFLSEQLADDGSTTAFSFGRYAEAGETCSAG